MPIALGRDDGQNLWKGYTFLGFSEFQTELAISDLRCRKSAAIRFRRRAMTVALGAFLPFGD